MRNLAVTLLYLVSLGLAALWFFTMQLSVERVVMGVFIVVVLTFIFVWYVRIDVGKQSELSYVAVSDAPLQDEQVLRIDFYVLTNDRQKRFQLAQGVFAIFSAEAINCVTQMQLVEELQENYLSALFSENVIRFLRFENASEEGHLPLDICKTLPFLDEDSLDALLLHVQAYIPMSPLRDKILIYIQNQREGITLQNSMNGQIVSS